MRARPAVEFRQQRIRHDARPTATLTAALEYAGRGWPVFPVRDKRPVTQHGRSDASRDPDVISDWFMFWPDAEIALATGLESGIVALDVDISETVFGPDSLEALGVSLHPETPTAHTPRGGFHLLFRHPGAGHYVKTIAGRLGPGLDIRGDGGSITLPPGAGRCWDAVYGVDSPLAAMPAWMRIPEPAAINPGPAPSCRVELTRYGEAALDDAVAKIRNAPDGQQEITLNREVHSIGRLAGGGVIPAGLALECLLWAARNMPSYDGRRPWRSTELDTKVRASFTTGLTKPRRPA